MFSPSRGQARAIFFEAWGKYRERRPIEGPETLVLEVVLLHPEYPAMLDAPERHAARVLTCHWLRDSTRGRRAAHPGGRAPTRRRQRSSPRATAAAMRCCVSAERMRTSSSRLTITPASRSSAGMRADFSTTRLS